MKPQQQCGQRFVVSMHANDGAVGRALGLIDRRGHQVVKMKMHMPTDTTYQLDLVLKDGTARQNVLLHQLNRLGDVFNVLCIRERSQQQTHNLDAKC